MDLTNCAEAGSRNTISSDFFVLGEVPTASLLMRGASEQAIAEHLLSIEREQMGLRGTPMNQLLKVAAHLRNFICRLSTMLNRQTRTNQLLKVQISREIGNFREACLSGLDDNPPREVQTLDVVGEMVIS